MSNTKCEYSSTCPVFNGILKEDDKPTFVYWNVFCNRGVKGWNACKRFHIYELEIVPSKDLMPGSSDSIENILAKKE